VRILLAGILGSYVATIAVLSHLHFAHRDEIMLVTSTLLFTGAVLVLARLRATTRQLARLVVIGGAALQLAAWTHAPLTSDDAYRYLWDGKVQLAGIDPYRYAPSAPQLMHMRDTFIFGTSSRCTYPISHGCTAINRPDVHTIYPPVAEGAFVAGRVVSFGGTGGLLVFQVLAGLGAMAITFLLIAQLIRRKRPIWQAALWAWCPIIALEFGQNGHIDWLAVLCCVVALQAGGRGRNVLAGGLVGAAIATKLYPLLILPSLMRRRPWVVPLAALAVVVAGYLPHVAAVGRAVIGYLPGYLHEEGYSSGTRSLLLGAIIPHPVDVVVAALLLVALGYWSWRRSDPAAPEQTATVLIGATFLVSTPAYGWYAALLVALVVMSGRLEWIAVAVAPSVVYLVRGDLWHGKWPSALVYLVAALLTLSGWRWRIRLQQRPVGKDVARSFAGYVGSRGG
jgi:Glycosyltransferase family 87